MRYLPHFLATLALGVALADPIALKVQGPDTVGNPVYMTYLGPSSPGSLQTQLTASTETINATAASASLAATVGKTNYVSGIFWCLSGTTATQNTTLTLSGIAGGSLSFDTKEANTVTTNFTFSQAFNPPLAASGTNQAITLASGTPGAGNTLNLVSLWGYQQ